MPCCPRSSPPQDVSLQPDPSSSYWQQLAGLLGCEPAYLLDWGKVGGRGWGARRRGCLLAVPLPVPCCCGCGMEHQQSLLQAGVRTAGLCVSMCPGGRLSAAAPILDCVQCCSMHCRPHSHPCSHRHALVHPHASPLTLALQVGHKVMYVAQPGQLTSAHLRADMAGQGQGVQDMRQADSAVLPEVEQEAASAAVEAAAGAGPLGLWLSTDSLMHCTASHASKSADVTACHPLHITGLKACVS